MDPMSLALHPLSCAQIDHIEMQQRWWRVTVVYRMRHHGPVRINIPPCARRCHARGCHTQAARWKRRRFIQSLRRTA